MSNSCRPRNTTHHSYSHIPPHYILPPTPKPIDDLIHDLRERARDDEILINGMQLMFESVEARNFMATTSEIITTAVTTGKDDEIKRCLELLMAIAFLTGTAVGFVAGLQFEQFDPDGGDDDNDYPPDYENPMI